MKLYLLELLAMDAERMTPTDWDGDVVTIITFVILAIAYFKVFHPKNRKSLESHRYHLIDQDKDVPYRGSAQRSTKIRHQ